MKNYDLPDFEGLSPENAERVLRQYRAEITADGGHPFNSPQHFQYSDAVKCFDALNAMIRAGEADADHEAEKEFFAEALGDEPPCRTRAELNKRVEALMRTPGYLVEESGGSRLLAADRERITRKIHCLTTLIERGDAEGQRIAAEERAAARQEAGGDADADADDGDGADAGGDADAGGEAW